MKVESGKSENRKKAKEEKKRERAAGSKAIPHKRSKRNSILHGFFHRKIKENITRENRNEHNAYLLNKQQ